MARRAIAARQTRPGTRRHALTPRPILERVDRINLTELLEAAALAPPTWLLAAAAALATAYLGVGEHTRWSATRLLIFSFAAGAAVAAVIIALRMMWGVARELWRGGQRDGDAVVDAAPDPELAAPLPSSEAIESPADIHYWDASPAPVALPEAFGTVMPPVRRLYLPAELEKRLAALSELSRQIGGPVREAFDFGHEMSGQIDEEFRNNSKQEIIDKLEVFKSFTQGALKSLAEIARKYPFYREIKDMGPWDYRAIVDKTEILTAVLQLVPEQELLEMSFSAPALRAAGPEWASAVDGFGSWIAAKQHEIAAQQREYETQMHVRSAS